MPSAKLPDAQIFYEWSGPEHAPVLVLSNSLGTTHRMWDPQVAAFTRHFHLLRYDTRGHGQSSVTPGPYSIEKLSWDVVCLLDFLHLDRVHFCGLSMGGMTGMFLGANAANRFHKIVLCNTAAKIGTPETWNARIDAVQKGGMRAVTAGIVERWLTPAYRASHPAETAAVLRMLEEANPEGYVACCAAVRDMDQRQNLQNVKVPALVLAGTHDAATLPADGQLLAKHIPGASYVELNAAHLSNIEAQDDFNSRVVNFLAK
ncbi:MAG: 3-oxoadipate enol-lactonase [Candidatus Acidiferrum sp.]